jgi:hypothetical protein
MDINVKRANFVRLAEARTEAILNKIRVLGNCSNTASYSYEADDIKKIFEAIQVCLDEAKEKFNPEKQFTYGTVVFKL